MKISNFAVERLRRYAGQETASRIAPDSKVIYEKGLADGAATLAEWILTEIEEETNAQ